MSDPTRPYEPMTSENAALVLVDHQVGLMTGVRDYSTGELKQGLGRFGQRDVCEVVAPSQRPVCSDKDLLTAIARRLAGRRAI